MSLERYGVPVRRVEAEAVDVAAEILDAAGVAFTLARGGKHLAMTTEAGHKIIFSGSPRSDCHRNHARQRAQRLVRIEQQGKGL